MDNTSLAVKRVLPGSEREETGAFHGWRGCFPLHVDSCAPAKGNEKGSVERGNEYVRGLFFPPIPETASWDELNAALQAELERDLDHRKLPDGAPLLPVLEFEAPRNARVRPGLQGTSSRGAAPVRAPGERQVTL